jgi:copper chaperone
MTTTTLKITGMSCDHCVRAVAAALGRVSGVERTAVDLRAGRATIDYDESRTTPRALAAAVMDEGYMAEESA